MKPTLEYVKQKFKEFNSICFKNTLPPLPIHLSNSKTYLGQLGVKKLKGKSGKYEKEEFSMRISTRFDFPENEIEDTILHEMIHYYIFYNHLHDTSSHGTIFRSMMEKINREYHRNISISHHLSTEDIKHDERVYAHFVCISKWKDGIIGLTPVARTRIFQIWDQFSRNSNLVQQTWYRSFNPYFNQFRNFLTPKMYKADIKELQEILKNADELERAGKSIFIKRKEK